MATLYHDDTILLRPTTAADVAFVVALEARPEHRDLIAEWTEQEHRTACAAADVGHWIVEAVEPARRVGFVVVFGLRDGTDALYVKRMVIADKGLGFGRRTVRALRAVAAEHYAARRLWLEVYEDNVAARAFYASEGFVVEGMRPPVPRSSGREASLVVMGADL